MVTLSDLPSSQRHRLSLHRILIFQSEQRYRTDRQNEADDPPPSPYLGESVVLHLNEIFLHESEDSIRSRLLPCSDDEFDQQLYEACFISRFDSPESLFQRVLTPGHFHSFQLTPKPLSYLLDLWFMQRWRDQQWPQFIHDESERVLIS